MKRFLPLLLCAALLAGCSGGTVAQVTPVPETAAPSLPEIAQPQAAPEYVSRFSSETCITLSDSGITVNGGSETDAVYTSHDIIFYENQDTYDSGNPYGEGTDADKHTAEEAAAHTVVNITAPGTYRICGTLSAGQIRIDLGEDAASDPDAVAELILENAQISCTVAPAILFLNTYECDGGWSAETARPDVDTANAGANLILEGENTVSGSYVAKIFRDQEEEQKLWKQDGAIYSYMSLNVFGPGSLDLTAANEGLDSELHLTVNGGTIRIFADNDGINTNEDNVSVTTVNGGSLTIYAGLGAEGDGIDSNGYLVINGGSVVASANPAADAGLDADLGSFIHGGTVIAMGSAMEWAESDSGQVTMNLQFAQTQAPGAKILVTREDGTELFRFASDTAFERAFSGLILSHPAFAQGETYHVYVNDVRMAYTGTDTRQGGPGGFGGRGGAPEDFDPGQPPENFQPGQAPEHPQDETLPAAFDPAQTGPGGRHPGGSQEDRTPPDDFPGEMPVPAGDARQDDAAAGEPSCAFFMNDLVNFFSGVTAQ